jgi:hypothetical protein
LASFVDFALRRIMALSFSLLRGLNDARDFGRAKARR